MFQRLAGKLILKRSLQQAKPRKVVAQYGTSPNPNSSTIAETFSKKVIKYATFGGIFLTATYGASRWIVRQETSNVYSTFSSKPAYVFRSPDLIDRTDPNVSRAIASGTPVHNYFIVTGEKFSGTSMLVEHLNSEVNEKGSVLATILDPSDFDTVVALAGALNVDMDSLASRWFFWKPEDDLTAMLEVIEKGAEKFFKETKIQPVLIIDEFDDLFANKDAYHKLLNQASEWAKSGVCRVVFVMGNNKDAKLDRTVFPPPMVHVRASSASDSEMEKFIRTHGQPEVKSDKNLTTLVKDIIGGNFSVAMASKEVILEHQASTAAKVATLCDQDKRVSQVLAMARQTPGIKLSDVLKQGDDLEEVVNTLILEDVLVKGVDQLYFSNRAFETAAKKIRLLYS